MMNRKVFTLKGMTITENLIAFVLLIAALTISGTGFYTAGDFINKGRMYEDASDRAQIFMESGIVDEVVAAFKEGFETTQKNNKFDSSQMQNKLKNIEANGTVYSFKYSSKSNYYIDEKSLIIIKPFSADAGASQKTYNRQNEQETAIDGKLTSLTSMYLYIAIPVDPEEVLKIKKDSNCTLEEAIMVSSYVPLVYYIEDWPY